MRVIKLTLEYDGTGLSGWQRQDNALTVQEHVEYAVEQMIGSRVHVQGASRTDAGVHAKGQVAHFSTEAQISTIGFLRGLNSHLPPGIAVIGCMEAVADFHARFHARGKHYRYAVFTRSARSPLLRYRAWHRPYRLNESAMQRAADHMLGERDFSAFRASGCTARTTTRFIESVSVSRPQSDLWYIDVRGNAFLRNMVRIMAGTLVDVGRGRMHADDIIDILQSGERTRAGQTAPPYGLTLMRVFY